MSRGGKKPRGRHLPRPRDRGQKRVPCQAAETGVGAEELKPGPGPGPETGVRGRTAETGAGTGAEELKPGPGPVPGSESTDLTFNKTLHAGNKGG